MTKIKLWISDIDGTLINYDGSCTPLMMDVIKKVNNSSAKLILATGRMYMGAKYASDKFNLNNRIVCYQGAVVRTKDEILWCSNVKKEIAREVILYLRSKKIHTHVYDEDILYTEDDNKEIMDAYCKGRGTTYEVINFDELKLNSVAKILAVIQDKKIIEKTKKDLAQKYKGILTIVQSSNEYLEITDKNASKGNALNFLKKYYNVSTSEVLASGDQDNDIDMLNNAGIKIAVGKNSEKLLLCADYKCESVNSDELPKLIERFILCE